MNKNEAALTEIRLIKLTAGRWMNDQKLTEIEDNWMSNEVEFNSGPIGLNDWSWAIQKEFDEIAVIDSQKERKANEMKPINCFGLILIWFGFSLIDSFRLYLIELTEDIQSKKSN